MTVKEHRHDTGRTHVCERCDRPLDEALTVIDSYPDLCIYSAEFRASLIKMCEDRGDPIPPTRRYHEVWDHGRKHLCGPMHPETEQEYFVRWVQS